MGPGTSLRTCSDRHERLSSSRCRSPTRRMPIHARGFALAAVFDSGWQPPAQTTSRIRDQRRLHAAGHAALRVALIGRAQPRRHDDAQIREVATSHPAIRAISATIHRDRVSGQYGLDVLGRQEDHRLLEHRQRGIPLGLREEPVHQRRQLAPRPGGQVEISGDGGTLSPHRPAADLLDQRAQQLVMPASCSIAHVAGPRWMVRLLGSLSEVALDGVRDLLAHDGDCTDIAAPDQGRALRLHGSRVRYGYCPQWRRWSRNSCP